MPKEILSMRKMKDVLRLRHEKKLSQECIAKSTGIPRSTVRDYLSRANAAGLTWPLPDNMDNEELVTLLFASTANKAEQARPVPDFSHLHKELKRKGVTLQTLWEEYKREHPDGYQYTWFASQYRQWAKTQDVWMPQTHHAGDKAFVDYSGLTIPIWETNLQEIHFQAEYFVAVLGASDLIFCVASPSQKLEDWIDVHNQMFHYYGGVVNVLVPDNLRSAVTSTHRYEPLCNRTYDEMAEHYGCVVMPARSYKPRDKAKAEKAVQTVQRRILAPLRDKQFTSLQECNEAIAEKLEDVNNRSFQKLPYSRRELFASIEQEALAPLPAKPYQMARWYSETVNGGYHIYVNQHYYSVPYHYVRKKVDTRVSLATVEIFYQEKRIACHQRDDTPQIYSTQDQHRPEAHRQQTMWQSKRLLAWAEGIGPYAKEFINKLLQDEKRHLHQKERSALGILRLSHAYSEQQLEIVCRQALDIGTVRYDSIVSLLKRSQGEMTTQADEDNFCETEHHENVRGANYYH